jgi:hypothetical protein
MKTKGETIYAILAKSPECLGRIPIRVSQKNFDSPGNRVWIVPIEQSHHHIGPRHPCDEQGGGTLVPRSPTVVCAPYTRNVGVGKGQRRRQERRKIKWRIYLIAARDIFVLGRFFISFLLWLFLVLVA